jgi:hypothetical protein
MTAKRITKNYTVTEEMLAERVGSGSPAGSGNSSFGDAV